MIDHPQRKTQAAVTPAEGERFLRRTNWKQERGKSTSVNNNSAGAVEGTGILFQWGDPEVRGVYIMEER